ncbi:hypothetical protein ACFYUY_01435 [Kitasatospora sp. NPDC004745]|uniref:hypothetical protein n=1 Tax=Kitasatospora sp. NPDC004745 TaxID=3364019 RepID=UPI0036CFFDA8
MSQTITQLTDGAVLPPTGYDNLVCCGQSARVAHATNTLPVPGAVCESCWCTVTSSPGYGPITVRRCNRHGS